MKYVTEFLFAFIKASTGLPPLQKIGETYIN